jgi:hypothetical protein
MKIVMLVGHRLLRDCCPNMRMPGKNQENKFA